MVILGLSDGPDAGAALVIDDELVAYEPQERHDRVPRSMAFPWGAIEEVLEEAGIKARHVDEVAVGGRFTPPFFLRRHPALRTLARDAFSPLVDAGVFYQAMLRQSGLGALEADRVGEWIEGMLRKNGFSPQRTTMVDVHRALAEAAYRTQPDDDVLVVTFQPLGDGTAVAVHRGAEGQLDKLWTQKGFSALHVHLRRCASVLGVGPHDLAPMWAMAASAEPDSGLVSLLAGELRAEGPRLSRRPYPLPEPRNGPAWTALADADPDVAAASILENVTRAVMDVVVWHLRQTGARRLAVGGSVLENPRLCAALAALDGLESFWVTPIPGPACEPIGAAVGMGGLAPKRLPIALGRQFGERQCARALSVAGLQAVKPSDDAEAAAGLLAGGAAVARFQGRAGFGRHGGGTRSVLVRADDRAALDRARAALGRPDHEEPACFWLETPGGGTVRDLGRAPEAARFGTIAFQADATFAAKHPAAVTADGRVLLHRVDPDGDAGLHRMLVALHRRTGCAAVAALPLAEENDPVVGVPGDALRVWRRAGIEALLLGPFLVQGAAPPG
jgi:carbamoyltransferase